MKKKFTFKFMLLLFALVVGCSNVWADEYELYSGTITEGDYVIVYGGVAMKNTVTSSRLDYQSVIISNNKISNPGAAIVWHIAASGDYWTIYNANVNKYAASTGAKNKAQLLESGTDDMSLWTVSGSSTYEFVNKKNDANKVNKNLRRNGTYGFACYGTDTGRELSLYKKIEAAGAATTVTIDDSGLTNTNKFFGTEAGTLTAAVTVTSSSASVVGATVTWSSDDEDVATVDEYGVVTLVAEGSTTITASYAGDPGNYKSSYAEYVLNVTDESPFNYTLWSEDFGTYSATDKPSGGPYSYVCEDGGSNTQIYEADLAGGTSPELLVNKNGGTFQATIPLDNITGNLKLKFKSNAYAITVSTSTDGISISGDYSFNTAGEHTVTFTGIIPSKTSIVIIFAAGSSSNVRIDDITLTGAIPGNNNHELIEDFTIPTGTTFDITSEFIIPDGVTLTVNGTLENDDPANLIIEDGAQLICNNAVEATVEKSITAATDWGTASNGWYFIASPLVDNTDPDDVNNMITPKNGDDYTFDLYRYNDAAANNLAWENYNNATHTSGFKLVNGQGYLYANVATKTLEFTGEIKPYTTAGEANKITIGPGFNLIGNPYTFATYINKPYYKLNAEGNTILASEVKNVAINPCTGVIVNGGVSGYDIFFTETSQNVTAVNPGNIQMALAQTVATRDSENTETIDNAIVSFNEGSELPKFYFGTQNANIYIPMDNEEYAIVSSNAQGEMPVNFRAYVAGEYTITVNPEEVEMGYLHLIDNIAGKDVDLLATPSYTFNARTDDYESRFRLVFSTTMVNAEMGEDFAFISDGQLVIANEGEAILQVIDVTGRVVAIENINGTCSKAINAKAGVYVLRLINGTDVKTQKMVIR